MNDRFHKHLSAITVALSTAFFDLNNDFPLRTFPFKMSMRIRVKVEGPCTFVNAPLHPGRKFTVPKAGL